MMHDRWGRGPVLSVPLLAGALAQKSPVTLLDVRWWLGGPPGRTAYEQGHLPGAVFVDLDVDLADPPGVRGRHPLPDPQRFATAMRAAGVRANQPVVVYDQGPGVMAARAWWLLRHHGHPLVRVLNGGIAAWQAADQPVTTATSTPQPGDFVAAPGVLPVLGADGAARIAAEGMLLDVRAGERYRGELEPVDPVAGHIPGAVNAPDTASTDADGLLLPADELRQYYAALGVRTERPVAVYCGSGVTAAHAVLTLEAAGFAGAGLYPGSWSEWVADPTRPVATGPG